MNGPPQLQPAFMLPERLIGSPTPVADWESIHTSTAIGFDFLIRYILYLSLVQTHSLQCSPLFCLYKKWSLKAWISDSEQKHWRWFVFAGSTR